MEAILALVVIGGFVWFMRRRGAFTAEGQPAAVERDAWPRETRRDDEPAVEENWSVETHGWPPEGSPRWRLGGSIHTAGGGDGMMSGGGAGGGAGGGGGGDGGGGGGGC